MSRTHLPSPPTPSPTRGEGAISLALPSNKAPSPFVGDILPSNKAPSPFMGEGVGGEGALGVRIGGIHPLTIAPPLSRTPTS